MELPLFLVNPREYALRQREDRIYRLTIGEAGDNRWQRLINLLTEQGYGKALLGERLGLSTRLDTKDRRILEDLILPYYRSDEFKRVLFVGCAGFTAHYQQDYFADKEFWTIEPGADQAKFGSDNHVVAPLEDASKHFEPGYFDVLLQWCLWLGPRYPSRKERTLLPRATARCERAVTWYSAGMMSCSGCRSIWTTSKIENCFSVSTFPHWTPGGFSRIRGIGMCSISIGNESS